MIAKGIKNKEIIFLNIPTHKALKQGVKKEKSLFLIKLFFLCLC